MQVLPVNNSSLVNKNGFQGRVDKSVYKYIAEASLHHKNSKEANDLSSYITKKLEKFMEPFHEDTIFSVVEDLHAKEYWLPFPTPHAEFDFVSIGDFKSLFVNKKIKSEFSLSRKYERIKDENSGNYYDIHTSILPPSFSEALDRFKTHVDDIVDFFGKYKNDFSVDSILYNQKLRSLKYYTPFTPEIIKNFKFKRIQEQKPEFCKKSFNENIYVEKIVI